MKFVTMENGLPKRTYNKLDKYLEEFVRMNVPVARVDLDDREYASPSVARSVIGVACKRWAVPVKAVLREGKVYLVRTDM